LSRTASDPQVARETEYYRANIGNVKSIDDFLKNDRLYRYALKAFGLDDVSYAKAFIKKVLKEGIDDRNAFANKLADPRYRDLAATFNFARNGEATTSTDAVKQTTVDRYVQLTLEQTAGAQNEGVRLALYFARKAPELRSTLGILADKALLKVAQTALRIPAATSAIDIDKQVEIYAKRVNVEDFKDPKKLEAFINRFTTLYELDNGSAANPASSPSSILVGGRASFGISASTLASIQSLKLGGL
jgi:hypothetical protein